MTSEFARPVAIAAIGTEAQTLTIEANADERVALARRFDLVAIETLSAAVTHVTRDGGIDVDGRLSAAVVQTCVVTGDPVRAALDVPFALRFVDPARFAADAAGEIEIDDGDCDVVAHDGISVDLGEAVAQTLALALDPFPRRVEVADESERKWTFGADASPFAGLKQLLERDPL